MQTITIQATTRTAIGRKNYALRSAGQVPAVLYGTEKDPQSVTVDRKALSLAFRQAGESTLVDLVIDNETPVKVLIQDLQVDPIYSEIIHADFRRVDLNKPIEAEIKLHFVGEAPAVKELGGTMVHAISEIRVTALPTDLVPSIDVDVSTLKTFDDTIHLKDLVLPPGLTVEDDLEETIALVAAPRSEEELAELDRAVEEDVGAIEVAGKKEEEGAAEEAVEEGAKEKKEEKEK